MADTRHDRIAKVVAKKRGGTYNPGKGADIVKSDEVIEIEVDSNTFSHGIRQLQGYRKRRYLAVPNSLVKVAEQRTKNLKVGVIDDNGRVRKRSIPPKRRKR